MSGRPAARTIGQYDGDGRWTPSASPAWQTSAAVALRTTLPSSSVVHLRCQNSSSDETSMTSSKLWTGVGFGLNHSRLRASHGSGGSGGRPRARRADRITLITKNMTPRAMTNTPMVANRFQKSNPKPGEYVSIRRDMPFRPRMCIGPNARLKPMSIVQKFHLPRVSPSLWPNTLGHQK